MRSRAKLKKDLHACLVHGRVALGGVSRQGNTHINSRMLVALRLRHRAFHERGIEVIEDT